MTSLAIKLTTLKFVLQLSFSMRFFFFFDENVPLLVTQLQQDKNKNEYKISQSLRSTVIVTGIWAMTLDSRLQ